MRKQCLMLLALAIMAGTTSAQTVYRSVDKDGNVSFSDAPVPGNTDAEEITIDAPPPSVDRVRESELDANRAIKQANKEQVRRDAAREERSLELREAEKALNLAEKNLEEAKVVREGDTRGKAGGGTRLTSQYLNRVKAAEKDLAEAQDHMNKFTR